MLNSVSNYDWNVYELRKCFYLKKIVWKTFSKVKTWVDWGKIRLGRITFNLDMFYFGVSMELCIVLILELNYREQCPALRMLKHWDWDVIQFHILGNSITFIVLCQNQEDMVESMKHFVSYLTREMRKHNTHSQVIWYDSVTKIGKLDWQNELNSNNRYNYKHYKCFLFKYIRLLQYLKK